MREELYNLKNEALALIREVENKKELEDLKSKLEKINLDKTKKEIKEKIKDLFFVEIAISS